MADKILVSRIKVASSLLKADEDRHSRAIGQSSVIERAVKVICYEPQAMRWLGTPVPSLDYAPPLSLLHSVTGRRAVLTVLGRLEHGVV